MKAADILVRPVITEKVNTQMEKAGTYTFVINKRANKLEVKTAIETFYGVKVQEVNTCVVPAKAKTRMTKAGILSGRKSGYKKAIVKLVEGDSIDLFQ